eukprot:TRINITY_DN5638_c0_g1_i1.p1 TRINITY_DN5638_c0_g1~~TRINITY_DN5638_c0_g1_i1.p1  ORF type:complete len:404 (+),score=37.25 TRINITY_DN5638_c0_g1_i1:138-1349(+)
MPPPRRPHRITRAGLTHRRPNAEAINGNDKEATAPTTRSAPAETHSSQRSYARALQRYFITLFKAFCHVMRVGLMCASLYLWNYSSIMLSYIGCVAVFSLVPLLLSTGASLRADVARGNGITPIMVAKTLGILAPTACYLLCGFQLMVEEAYTLLIWLHWPVVFRLLGRYAPLWHKATADHHWGYIRSSHYKMSNLSNAMRVLLREMAFDMVYGVVYPAAIPLTILPSDRKWMSPALCVMMAVLGFLEQSIVTIFELYRVNGHDLYMGARTLGAWKRVTANATITWQPGQKFEKNTVVRHRKKAYRGLDVRNWVDPSDTFAHWFWRLFRRPDDSLQWVIGSEGVLIVVQVVALMLMQHWLLQAILTTSLTASYMILGYGIWLRRHIKLFRITDEAAWLSKLRS